MEKSKTYKISDLLPDPVNARKHSRKNIEAIMASLKRFGQQKPIVIDQKNIVRAGNGTFEAAEKLGWDKIEAVVSKLSPEELSAFAIADNRTSELAEWDESVLIEQARAMEKELLEASWQDFEFPMSIDELMDKDDDIPSVEKNEYGVKEGDVWIMGSHRLMCGDSTRKDLLEILLDGHSPDMIFTDPPYGLGGYAGRGKNTKKKVKNDDLDPSIFYGCIPEAPEIYVWGLFENLKHLNFEPKSCIVWRKNNIGMGRGYRGQYEVCFYKGSFKGSDSNLWDVKKDVTYMHPTQKPVELVLRAIKNSKPETVLDMYSGSGSTLIGCEKSSTRFFGVELDPAYCSLIIRRWEEFSGKKAEQQK
jgi:site-specific DNA-methyltransferase (adenine-specific)